MKLLNATGASLGGAILAAKSPAGGQVRAETAPEVTEARRMRGGD